MPRLEQGNIQRIIFYDDQCGICHFAVSNLLKIDRQEVFFYAPINGKTYHELGLQQFKDIDSVIYYRSSKIEFKSSAVINALIELGFPFNLFGLLKIFPRRLLDYGYDQIAKRRKRNQCFSINFKKHLFLP